MASPPITTLIFDLDGVLADLCELHRDLFIDAFNAGSSPAPSAEGAGASPSPLLSKALHAERLEGLSTRAKLRACRELFPGAKWDDDAIYDAKQARTMEALATMAFPSRTREALAWARGAGLRVGVFTNSIRATLDCVLERLGATELFDLTLSNEDVPAAKPSPSGYLLALERLKVGPDPRAALIFEDSAHGLVAARGSGATVIPVLNAMCVTPGFLEEAVRTRAPPAPRRITVIVPLAGSRAAERAFLPAPPRAHGGGGHGSSEAPLLAPNAPLWHAVVARLLPLDPSLRACTSVHVVVRASTRARFDAHPLEGVTLHSVPDEDVSTSSAPAARGGQLRTVLSLRDVILGGGGGGAAEDVPLVIANGDAFLEWDRGVDLFYRASLHGSYDGAVSTFYHPYPEDLRWSYAAVSSPEGLLLRIAEKEFVGPHATTGIYAWRSGAAFVSLGEALAASGETYVAPVYAAALRKAGGSGGGARFRTINCENYWPLKDEAGLAAFAAAFA